jgi:RNA polymerase sigma-70 factor (ECF subfamily)
MPVNLSEKETPAEQSERFTATHWSQVLEARDGASPQAAEALERLCRTYWYPLYAYVRRQGKAPHDAQDLTQEFFARLLAGNFLKGVQRQKGKFRSFLLASMNHFLADASDRANAAKRGGGQVPTSLSQEDAENRYLADAALALSPESIFEKRWATALLEEALQKLRQEFAASGKLERFEALSVFLQDGSEAGDYVAVGTQLGMTANAVAAAVQRLRERYRELVRAEIAHTVETPEDLQEEMRHLLAVLAR